MYIKIMLIRYMNIFWKNNYNIGKTIFHMNLYEFS